MTINFHYEIDFRLADESNYANWIERVVGTENKKIGELNYIFCSDDYLSNINQSYLDHDTFTDIITFDYSVGQLIQGDIFISKERLEENAIEYKTGFDNELLRVMSHGVLHLMGYNDKTKNEVVVMRGKEEQMIQLFHVEH